MYRVRYLNTSDNRLGRHVNHDPRSRRFPVRADSLVISSVRHERHVPVFDQGELGSCTGNAAIGCMATGVLAATSGMPKPGFFTSDEDGAVACYSRATALDSFSGVYPPTDTGSDGLSVAKALQEVGEISGYEHAFTMNQMLAALMARPLITGVNWTNDMFNPNNDGIVRPTGALAGGHEFVIDEYNAARGLLGFTNSWGEGWGLAGRFYMQAEDFASLLAQDGDVTAFTPVTAPAPTPIDPEPTPVPAPADSADIKLWAATAGWTTAAHTGHNKDAAKAVRTWAKAKGLR